MEGVWFVGENNKDLSFRKDLQEPEVKEPHDVKIKVAYSGEYLQKIFIDLTSNGCTSANDSIHAYDSLRFNFIKLNQGKKKQ